MDIPPEIPGEVEISSLKRLLMREEDPCCRDEIPSCSGGNVRGPSRRMERVTRRRYADAIPTLFEPLFDLELNEHLLDLCTRSTRAWSSDSVLFRALELLCRCRVKGYACRRMFLEGGVYSRVFASALLQRRRGDPDWLSAIKWGEIKDGDIMCEVSHFTVQNRLKSILLFMLRHMSDSDGDPYSVESAIAHISRTGCDRLYITDGRRSELVCFTEDFTGMMDIEDLPEDVRDDLLGALSAGELYCSICSPAVHGLTPYRLCRLFGLGNIMAYFRLLRGTHLSCSFEYTREGSTVVDSLLTWDLFDFPRVLYRYPALTVIICGFNNHPASVAKQAVSKTQILLTGMLSVVSQKYGFVPKFRGEEILQLRLGRPTYPFLNYLEAFPVSAFTDEVPVAQLNLGCVYFMWEGPSITSLPITSMSRLNVVGTGKQTRNELVADMGRIFFSDTGLVCPEVLAFFNTVTADSGGFDSLAAFVNFKSQFTSAGARHRVFGRVVGRVCLHIQLRRRTITKRLDAFSGLNLLLPAPSTLEFTEPIVFEELRRLHSNDLLSIPRDSAVFLHALISLLREVGGDHSLFFLVFSVHFVTSLIPFLG